MLILSTTVGHWEKDCFLERMYSFLKLYISYWNWKHFWITKHFFKINWCIYTMEYYSAIKKNTFESVLMRWMKTGAYYTEWSKPKRKTPIQYCIYMEFRKMGTITLYERYKRDQSFGLCGRGRGWADLGEWHWNMYNIICETNCQSRLDAWYRMLGAGVLGWPRGMVRGGRWEGGSGCGTCVHLWQIHVDVWQNQYNIVK